MENKVTKEFHLFLLTDYEKEEKLLRRKHQEGQKLTKVTLPGFYYFESCEPEDVVYRLDFNPQSAKDRVDYLKMYEDYGWEYMQDLNDYSYFRKSAEDVSEADTEIFSDNESRLAMLNRIFKKRMLLILVIVLCCVVPNIGNVVSGDQRLGWVLSLFWIIMFTIYALIIVRCGFGFYQLHKRYSGRS